jgi:transcriptional regulator with XRE-family HTH domain
MITHYLRAWRERRGMTQDALALKAGTFESVISRFETGGRGISLEMAVRLCGALDIKLTDLLTHPDDMQTRVEVPRVQPEKLADFERVVRALASAYRGE